MTAFCEKVDTRLYTKLYPLHCFSSLMFFYTNSMHKNN